MADLRPGDLVLVAPGARVPADGAVVKGESLPAPVRPGEALAAGEVNLTGPLTVRVTAAEPDSSLARMAALVAVAEEGRSRCASLTDRAAHLYAPVVHALALLAFAGWAWRTGGTCASQDLQRRGTSELWVSSRMRPRWLVGGPDRGPSRRRPAAGHAWDLGVGHGTTARTIRGHPGEASPGSRSRASSTG